MHTYQITFKGGRTHIVRADGYRNEGHNVLFQVANRQTERFNKDFLLMIEEVDNGPTDLPNAVNIVPPKDKIGTGNQPKPINHGLVRPITAFKEGTPLP